MRLLLFLCLPFLLFGAKALVSLDIDRAQEFFVSKKFIAVLKVKTTAFSISDLNVDFKNNNDFIIISPQSASYTSSEELGEETYQYSVYEYEFYPLKANGISIEPLEVSFNVSSGYGQPKEHFTLHTSKKELFITSVKDSDKFLLATPELSITSSYSTNLKSFKIGDAITQTIEIRAFDVPDVLIPKLKFPSIQGMKLYEDEDNLSQKKSKNILESKRIQSATYIFMKDGNFTLPKQKMQWYNTADSKIKTEESEAYSFEVIGEVLKEKKLPKKKENNNIKTILAVIVVLLILLSFILKNNKNKYRLIKNMNPE